MDVLSEGSMNRNIREYYEIVRARGDIKSVIAAQNCIIRNDIKAQEPACEGERDCRVGPPNPYIAREKLRKRAHQALAEGNTTRVLKLLEEIEYIDSFGKVRAA